MGPGVYAGTTMEWFRPLSFRAFRPQIKRHDLTIPRYQNLTRNPDPRAVGGAGRRCGAAVRGRLARSARPPDPARPRARRCPDQARLSGPGRQAARRGHRAHDLARLIPEIRRPFYSPDPDRRPGVVSDRRLPGAG